MIDPAEKKLSIIFLSTMIGLIFAIFITVYLFMDYRLTNSVRNHLIEAIETEFMPHYRNDDFDVLSKIVEDELFQILNDKGEVVFTVKSSVDFSPELNRSLFNAASKGSQVFETAISKNGHYLVTYYPLDRGFIGRAVHPIEPRTVFRKNFVMLMIFALPLLLLLAYFSSRYMVSQSLKPLANVLKYQEVFSSSVSHELNSPMTSIKGSLEVALRRDRSPQEYQGFIISALKKIDDIIDLLSNLSLMATSKFKPLDLYRERVNMAELVEKVVDEYEPYIYAKSINLNLPVQAGNSCKEETRLECDATLMSKAVENLLDNAVKYTPAGGTIELSCRNDGNQFVFTIANSCEDVGRGELKSLFDPFYRGKSAVEQNREGRGLGLHVVQHIVFSHGGTLSSRLEKGILSFSMRIPRATHGNSLQTIASSAAR